MTNDNIRYYWLGFIVSAAGFLWLIWLWRKQREVMPRPLYVSGRTAAYPMSAVSDPDKPQPADDLESIQGIGPVYARRLNEAGINSFAQLAKADAGELVKITGVRGSDPGSWISEAQTLIARS